MWDYFISIVQCRYCLSNCSFILQANPPVLTLISCVVLAIVLIDLLVPVAARMLFKNDNWSVDIWFDCYPYVILCMHRRTSAKDAKYTRLCERIANFEQHIKQLCESALKMRKERPLMVCSKLSFHVILSFIPKFSIWWSARFSSPLSLFVVNGSTIFCWVI